MEQKKWLPHNWSKLNAEKTNALLVSSASNIKCVILCPLVLNDALITPSPVVHNLGVLLHSHLKVDLQLRSGSKKTYFHLQWIAKIKIFLSRPAICLLVRVFLISYLDYWNSLLVSLPNSQLEILQYEWNSSAARLITGARRFDKIYPETSYSSLAPH